MSSSAASIARLTLRIFQLEIEVISHKKHITDLTNSICQLKDEKNQLEFSNTLLNVGSERLRKEMQHSIANGWILRDCALRSDYLSGILPIVDVYEVCNSLHRFYAIHPPDHHIPNVSKISDQSSIHDANSMETRMWEMVSDDSGMVPATKGHLH